MATLPSTEKLNIDMINCYLLSDLLCRTIILKSYHDKSFLSDGNPLEEFKF